MGMPGGPGSVGGQGLLHPGHKCSDAGVHGGCGCGARAAAPGHDARQGPGSLLLADQGAARVALQEETGLSKPERSCQVLVCLELAEPRECRQGHSDLLKRQPLLCPQLRGRLGQGLVLSASHHLYNSLQCPLGERGVRLNTPGSLTPHLVRASPNQGHLLVLVPAFAGAPGRA